MPAVGMKLGYRLLFFLPEMPTAVDWRAVSCNDQPGHQGFQTNDLKIGTNKLGAVSEVSHAEQT